MEGKPEKPLDALRRGVTARKAGRGVQGEGDREGRRYRAEGQGALSSRTGGSARPQNWGLG